MTDTMLGTRAITINKDMVLALMKFHSLLGDIDKSISN